MSSAIRGRLHPKLCVSCVTIFSSAEAAHKLVTGGTIEYCLHYKKLQESDPDGCPFCRTLFILVGFPPMDLIDKHLRQAEDPTDDGETEELQGKDMLRFLFKGLLPEDGAVSRPLIEGAFTDGIMHTIEVVYRREAGRDKVGYLEISTNKDNPAASMILLRSPYPKVKCPDTLSRIRAWLEDCHSNHSQCNECQLGQAKASIVPSYILNVALAVDKVRLEEAPITSEGISYGALSYCWGAEQPQQTTSLNIQKHKAGIAVLSLPRTIQDAITVSKALGLKYLWVDSLCIIQDSAVHKQRELRIMGTIYHNAYVVISAASAATCNDGFLQDRPPPRDSFRVPFGNEGSADIIPKLTTNVLMLNKGEALHDRAWAYQESFMARRLLVFTSNEMIWSCLKTGQDGSNRRERLEAMTYFDDSCRFAFQLPEVRDWGFIILAFSSRKITRDSDKLPALSGIAELFDWGRGMQYVAGMWLNDGVAAQLMTWFASETSDGYGTSRPRDWRAPSWSYISVNGPVRFIDLNRLQGFEWVGDEFCAQLLSDDNPYGEVTSASMRLRNSRLMKVKVSAKQEPMERSYRLQLPDDSNGFERYFAANCDSWTINFDSITPATGSESPSIASCYGQLPLDTTLWWFLMWYSHELVPKRLGPSALHISGLALAKLSDGRFHRVGYIKCYSKEGKPMVEDLKKLPFHEFTFV